MLDAHMAGNMKKTEQLLWKNAYLLELERNPKDPGSTQ